MLPENHTPLSLVGARERFWGYHRNKHLQRPPRRMGCGRRLHWRGRTFLSVQCPTSPKPVLREGQLGSQQSPKETHLGGLESHCCTLPGVL